MESERASITALCRSAITRTRLTAATAACLAAVVAVSVPGHSDGALAAALAARREEGIAFLVMLAGSGLPGVETAADQAP